MVYKASGHVKPDDKGFLRSLVFEHLVHHGYVNTAKALANDNSSPSILLDADGDEAVPSQQDRSHGTERLSVTEDDLLFIARRKEINTRIRRGEITEAIRLLETHFPTVLKRPQSLPPSSPPPAPPAHTTSSTPSQMPPTRSNTATPAITTVSRADTRNAPRAFIANVSLAPEIISLNLRIHSFIEELRTIPLLPNTAEDIHTEAPTTAGMDVDGEVDSRPMASAHKSLPPQINEPTPSHVSVNLLSTSTSTSASATTPRRSATSTPTAISTPTPADKPAYLILLARKLLASARALPHPHDRSIYDEELRLVSSLLAYSAPETAPPTLRRYLSLERRQSLAEQVNAAILKSADHRATSRLEAAARYTTFLWETIDDLNVEIPVQDSKLVPLLEIEQKFDVKRNVRRTSLTFDLHSFVDRYR